jgi:MFS family permease
LAQVLTSLRRHRNYRLYFGGQIVSASGTWMQDTALPWIVLQATHSPIQVGLLIFCRYGPFMVGGLYGGVTADRFDNRRILQCTQSVAMGTAAGLAAAAFLGQESLWLLYVLATVTGVALVFDSPSRHALIYQLVGRGELSNAVSLNLSIGNAAKVVGPALGGILIASVGPGWCFAINASTFLAMLAALAGMRTCELFPVIRGRRQTATQALLEARAFLHESRVLQVVLAIGLVLGLFGFSTTRTLLPVVAITTLHGGPRTFGTLLAAYGAGAVTGALLSAALHRTTLRLLIGGALLFSTPLALLGLTGATLGATASLFVVGIGWALWQGQAMAHVQLAAPDRMRGRLISVYMYTFMASAPLGGVLGGWLAETRGTKLALLVCGGSGVAAAVLGAAVLRVRDASLAAAIEVPVPD